MTPRRALVAGLLALAAIATPAGRAAVPEPVEPHPPARPPAGLALTASAAEPGQVSLAVAGPAGTVVDIVEQVGTRRVPVARVTLAGDVSRLPHAVRWRCDRRLRRFVATSTDAGGATQGAQAQVTTPSCAQRLALVAAPGRLRPGRAVSVRVTDTWRLGGVAATVCARALRATAGCRVVRLPAGVTRRRARIALPATGHWRIALRSTYGQRIERHVDVRRTARMRVLVSGDSMIYGIFEVLSRHLAPRSATVRGDPHPASGISRPLLAWPTHARDMARRARPDVTIVLLGAGDDSLPLPTPGGAVAQCCDATWTAAYANRVHAVMAAYRRGGAGLVYWVRLPVPRRAERLAEFRAIANAVRAAAARFDDGVVLVDDIAEVIAPNDTYTETIDYRGRRRDVRDDDGVHLSREGIHIATALLVRRLERDGLVATNVPQSTP